jgi:hypothetical protein
MESESFSQLLQKLADALRHWADRLPNDREKKPDAEFEFHEWVDVERLDVLAKLGADNCSNS